MERAGHTQVANNKTSSLSLTKRGWLAKHVDAKRLSTVRTEKRDQLSCKRRTGKVGQEMLSEKGRDFADCETEKTQRGVGGIITLGRRPWWINLNALVTADVFDL